MQKYFPQILLLIVFIGLGCQKSKVIDLDLPPQTPSLSVECYLEDGKSTRLLLTETSDYYQPGFPVDLQGALVTITHNGKTDTMIHEVHIDTLSSTSGKAYNYYLPGPIHAVPGDVYFLYIKDSKGREATAQTSFLDVVYIDSLYYSINEDDKASLHVEFQDNPSTIDQYRLLISKDTIGGSVRNDVLIKDDIYESKTIGFTTSYKFNLADSLNVDLYHINSDYYTFLRSVSDASNANGNPFAVPAKVKGNITGGIGIFEALTTSRKRIIIIK